jgi:hypothetical protein
LPDTPVAIGVEPRERTRVEAHARDRHREREPELAVELAHREQVLTRREARLRDAASAVVREPM